MCSPVRATAGSAFLIVTAPPNLPIALPRRETSRVLFAAGVLQIAATLTPAVRVRLVGATLFFRLPDAGALFLALGALTIAVALRPHGWWRWGPGVASGALLAVVHSRIVHAPTGTFIDPVLRHAVHPAWGFIPMSVAVLVSLTGAALVRTPRTISALVQTEVR
jgi:hypothetical protein